LFASSASVIFSDVLLPSLFVSDDVSSDVMSEFEDVFSKDSFCPETSPVASSKVSGFIPTVTLTSLPSV
jgi:hypothetical protein